MKLNPRISSYKKKNRKKFFEKNKKRKFLKITLSSDLRQKYKLRNYKVRSGDIVSIVHGDSKIKNKEGKVVKVFLKKGKIAIENIIFQKIIGKSSFRLIDHSNLKIIQFDLSDARRKKKLEKIRNE